MRKWHTDLASEKVIRCYALYIECYLDIVCESKSQVRAALLLFDYSLSPDIFHCSGAEFEMSKDRLEPVPV